MSAGRFRWPRRRRFGVERLPAGGLGVGRLAGLDWLSAERFAYFVDFELRERFPADDDAQLRQALALAAAGEEFAAAYRRWAGTACRGDWAAARAGLADVLVAAHVTAVVLGIDLEAAWREKAAVMLCGWREAADAPAGGGAP